MAASDRSSPYRQPGFVEERNLKSALHIEGLHDGRWPQFQLSPVQQPSVLYVPVGRPGGLDDSGDPLPRVQDHVAGRARHPSEVSVSPKSCGCWGNSESMEIDGSAGRGNRTRVRSLGSFCPTTRLAPRASLRAVRGYFSVWLGAQPRDRKVRPRKRQEQDHDPGFRRQERPKKPASTQVRDAIGGGQSDGNRDYTEAEDQ